MTNKQIYRRIVKNAGDIGKMTEALKKNMTEDRDRIRHVKDQEIYKNMSYTALRNIIDAATQSLITLLVYDKQINER